MIVVTGSKGFIGQNFLKHLLKDSNEKIITVNESDAWDWICLFKDWDKVSLILHQGAIASTTETDVDKLHRMNVWFSIELFEKAIKYQIPVKFASSASVYGHQLLSCRWIIIFKIILISFHLFKVSDTSMYMDQEKIIKEIKQVQFTSLPNKSEIQENSNYLKDLIDSLETLYV